MSLVLLQLIGLFAGLSMLAFGGGAAVLLLSLVLARWMARAIRRPRQSAGA